MPWSSFYRPQSKVYFFIPLQLYTIYYSIKKDQKMSCDWRAVFLKWWLCCRETTSSFWPLSQIACKLWLMATKNPNWSFWPVKDRLSLCESWGHMTMRSYCGPLPEFLKVIDKCPTMKLVVWSTFHNCSSSLRHYFDSSATIFKTFRIKISTLEFWLWHECVIPYGQVMLILKCVKFWCLNYT